MSKGELPIGEKLELRELKGRLVMENGRPLSYGTTNVAFQDDDETSSADSTSVSPFQLHFTLLFHSFLFIFCVYRQLIFIYTKKMSKIMTVDMAVADEKGEFRPDPEDGRESWDSKLQFMLATIGYAVGLGNVNFGDSHRINHIFLNNFYFS